MTDADPIKAEIAVFLDRQADRLEDSTMLSELVPDSFLLVELYVHLQHKFGAEISSDEAAVIATVGELVERIRSAGNA
jgi:acyl carrier protein